MAQKPLGGGGGDGGGGDGGGGDASPSGSAAKGDPFTSRPKNNSPAKHPPGGPPDDNDPADDEERSSEEDDDESDSRNPLVPRIADPQRSQRSRNTTRKPKEAEEVNISPIPRSASQYEPWINSVISSVTSAAADEDLALPWIVKVTEEDITFQDLGSADDHKSLDAKIRASLMRYTTGPEAEKVKDLIDEILMQSKGMIQAKPPTQIRGRQILHIIRTFYDFKNAKRMTFELRTLMELPYWGDGKLATWKRHWDNMCQNQRTPLSEPQKEELFIENIAGSDALRSHVEYYNRLNEDHQDHSYQFLSQVTDKVIKDARQRQHIKPLSSGIHELPRPAMPGTFPSTPENDPKGDEDPESKGSKGKGKSKGKEKGKPWDPSKRTCIHHLFGKCTHRDVRTG